MRNSQRFYWLPVMLPAACSQPAAVARPTVVVIGDTRDYPQGCYPLEVADLVLSFFTSCNDGDVDDLEQTFAEQIEWYSDGKTDSIQAGARVDSDFTTYQQDGLFPYFADRHAQGERLQLPWLSVVPKTWHGGVDIVYALRRRADDLVPGPDGMTRIGMGKGAVRCPQRKIFVWSLVTPPAWAEERDYVSESCAQEPAPADAVVVCAGAVS